MKSFSEEGLEACNKYIRREQLARKSSFEDNLRETFVRLLCQSNYLSLLQRKRLENVKVNAINMDLYRMNSSYNFLLNNFL